MKNSTKIYSKNPGLTPAGIFYFRIFLIFSICLLSLSAFSQAQLKFSQTKKKFGFVKQGYIVVLQYEFVNAGNEPLIISEVKAECSCTSVDYMTQPVAPNEKNKIIVKFDTKNTVYRQDRVIEVYSNDPSSPAIIRFKGVVKKSN